MINTGFSSWADKVRIFFTMCVPYIMLLLFFLCDHISYGNQYFQDIKPHLTLMALYYWSIYRPSLVPLWLAFIAGLADDLISGFPVGVNGLLYVLAQWVISSQRKIFFGQPFLTIFFGFCVLIASFYGLKWLMLSILVGQIMPFAVAFIKLVLGILMFPLVILLMRMVHKILPEEDMSIKKQPFSHIAR